MKTFRKIVSLFCVAAVFTVVLSSCADKPKETGTLDELDVSAIEKAVGSYEGDDEMHALYLNSSKGMSKLLSVSDLSLPETLTNPDNPQAFGLMIYNGSKYVPANSPDVFDETKKTLFFAHGMGYNASWYNSKGYYDAGYNVMAFYWGAFGGEDNINMPMVCDKMWFYDGTHRYRTEVGGEWQDGSSIEYSLVEIYAAYYCDFLLSHPDYDSKEIIVSGHSYGGMMTYGLLSYLTTAFRSGVLDARLLPDRAVLCDPYLMNGDSFRHIRWLNNLENPEYGGVAYLAYEAVLAAEALGISVSLVRTNNFIAMPITIAYPDLITGKAMLDKLNASLVYVDAIATSMLDLSESHNFGAHWPAYVTEQKFDTANPDEYAYSVFNPYHADYARIGETYVVGLNNTPYVLTDDTIALDYKGTTKLYGFVFDDVNGNGELDERLGKHICGAEVEIKNSSGESVFSTTTSLSGYFEYLAAPGEYTISVSTPSGYSFDKELTVTVEEGDYFAPVFVAANKTK